MKKLKYRILSHTADLRLEVFGKTIEELFKNGADAIADILHKRPEKSELHPNVPKEIIKVESVNINALLVDFLNEILAKSQINKAVYKVLGVRCQVSGVSASAEAELIGYPIKEFDEDIKAATYHEVDIKQMQSAKRKAQKIWHTKLVLDI